MEETLEITELSFLTRLQEEIELQNLSTDMYTDTLDVFETDYAPAVLNEIAFYKEFINHLQHKIWNCKSRIWQDNAPEKDQLFVLEKLDSDLRCDLAKFEEMLAKQFKNNLL
jgi:hypothetical protein